jgi:hypothetical protein
MFKLSGSVKVVNPTVQVNERFSKREFVLTDTSSMYPQDIQFQLTQDKCSLLDGVNVNDTIEVSFNIRGREWINPQGEAKYFNSLEAWRIDRLTANAPMNQAPSSFATSTPVTGTTPELTTAVADDDLPF